jgi:glycosyltransferase involved in cell wall biosynthesis
MAGIHDGTADPIRLPRLRPAASGGADTRDRPAAVGKSAGRGFWDASVTLSPGAAALHDPQQLVEPYDGDPLDLTVFVSCYNEADYIIDTLDTVRSAAREIGLAYEIIVIDDLSRDKSRDLVTDYIAAHPDERIMLRANRCNKGLAQNYLDGAFLGRGKYYRLICGDNAEPRDSIVAVFGAIGEADIIVPYYTSSEGKSRPRQIISSTYTGLVNLMTGNRLHYYNGLAVHLRHNVMRWHPNTRGFGFQADILCLLLDLGFSHKEVPVVTVEQRRGKSNALTFRNLISVAHTLIEIGNRRLSNRLYRRR